MQNDDIVSGWRRGADSVDGLDNPAGPLFVGGEAAAVAAIATPDAATMITATLTAVTCHGQACCSCY